jgi:hypothetical protein
MVPEAADLDYLRGKAAEYRRHAQAATAARADWLLELASRYELRVSELEAQHGLRPVRRGRHGRG